jgi:hypothetical protein
VFATRGCGKFPRAAHSSCGKRLKDRASFQMILRLATFLLSYISAPAVRFIHTLTLSEHQQKWPKAASPSMTQPHLRGRRWYIKRESRRARKRASGPSGALPIGRIRSNTVTPSPGGPARNLSITCRFSRRRFQHRARH